jgi:GT2 family glycosyltransferase
MNIKIAVLLASYNRKSKTIDCIKRIYEQQSLEGIEIDIYLTDDASTDGTFETIKNMYKEVNIFKGTGSLFWVGGMRNSWNQAIASKKEHDYYLLVNDDTNLYLDAINRLLSQSNSYFSNEKKHSIAIGSTEHPETGEISYGGRKLYNKYRPDHYIVFDKNKPMECDLGNANIMLVHKSIVDKIGMLSAQFTQGLADYDYTLRAKKNGFKVIVAPGTFGTCIDDHQKNWKSADTSLKERIQYLYSPKGLAYKEYVYYMKQHFISHVPEAVFKLWLKTLVPIVYDRFKRI